MSEFIAVLQLALMPNELKWQIKPIMHGTSCNISTSRNTS